MATRLVTANVLFGGYQPAGRLESLADLLRRSSPDLLLLQECMDWTEERLASMAELVGLPHYSLGRANARGSGHRYHLAALSRRPFEWTRTFTEGLAHCCLGVRIEQTTFWNLHLVARGEEDRLQELEVLRRHLFSTQERAVLAGDLNSLSPADPYPPGTAALLLRAGVEKYGDPFRFEVMERLIGDGWRDALQQVESSSWATRWRTETEPPTPTRTDYVLVSPGVKVAAVETLPLEHQESDHHPVCAVLD